MRRKSERNKAKASPEKKPEKPTRKSTRRRTKRSPSTSPDHENSNDTEELPIEKEILTTATTTSYKKVQTRLQSKETTETVVEEPETKVSSTEVQTLKIQDEIEDSGSVWKVARADASPGEIQKLKLCRQRNLSETSDISLSKKRSSKWQESGEGVTSGADSADEPLMTLNDGANVGNEALNIGDTSSSSILGRDSGVEVSDSKKIPPETTPVDLSDVKPKIDQQQQPDDVETNETTNCIVPRTVDENEDVPAEKPTLKLVTEKEQSIETQETLEHDGKQMQQQEQQTEEKPKNIIIIKEKEQEVTMIEEEKTASSEKVEKNYANISDKVKSSIVQKKLEIKDPSSSEENEKSKKHSSVIDSSDEESREQVKKITSRPTRLTRRKHRDKYRDSSNSDSADSEDEPIKKRGEELKKEREESKEIIENDREKMPIEEEHISRSPVVSNAYLKDSDKDQSYIEENVDDKQKVLQMKREKEDIVTSTCEKTQETIYKPTKVNLKRAFTRVFTNELKNNDANTLNDPSQDKENHVREDSKSIPKRRRWGTVLSTDATPVLSISTDSLQALVPGAKPLSINEVRLTKDDDEELDHYYDKEKRYLVNNGENVNNEEIEKIENSKENLIAARRKISIIKDTSQLKSPTSPDAKPSSILFIRNLVRPFTLTQIKELLSRTGTIVENGFWMDRIKSKAYVEYSNEDQAFETRQALHGISWPISNPKKLIVDYATKEAMNEAKESFQDQQISRKVEATSGTDGWSQNWDRDEKDNATTKVTVVREWDLGKEDGQNLVKDNEREKKDIDKKRRLRSRSPARETHLPAPARKFKKKEDEPPPAKLLDDLFKKTKTSPCIYWLPLTNEQIVVKEEMRRQHMAEHARRLEEMRRTERNRDSRRRRSPRK